MNNITRLFNIRIGDRVKIGRYTGIVTLRIMKHHLIKVKLSDGVTVRCRPCDITPL